MTFALSVSKREKNNADSVRAQGLVPGVVYGPDREPAPISVDYVTFNRLYNEAGESQLIDLAIEGEKEPVKVLIQDVQYDPIKTRITHVDFRQIRMGVEMHAAIELEFMGEAPAVKELGGTLVKTLDTVNVKCLPRDLVGSVQVDLSVLKTFDEAIHIKDLILPTGITVTDNPDTMIAKVAPPLTEDELKAMEEEGPKSVEDVEVEKKGKKEEEGAEGAEGAATADEGKDKKKE